MEPLVKVLDVSEHECLLVQSGQHIDFEMTESFFLDLNLRHPDFQFEIGFGSHSDQTASMLKQCEPLFHKTKPDLVLAEGDTNTVVGAGLAATKLHIPFGHVEAGLRSFDLLMPEEVNRRIADMCAAINFAPDPVAGVAQPAYVVTGVGCTLTANQILAGQVGIYWNARRDNLGVLQVCLPAYGPAGDTLAAQMKPITWQ